MNYVNHTWLQTECEFAQVALAHRPLRIGGILLVAPYVRPQRTAGAWRWADMLRILWYGRDPPSRQSQVLVFGEGVGRVFGANRIQEEGGCPCAPYAENRPGCCVSDSLKWPHP